ncbi:MAG: hypothetical protein AMXMBFR61_19690 [Fimbriimonadales bacterium]
MKLWTVVTSVIVAVLSAGTTYLVAKRSAPPTANEPSSEEPLATPQIAGLETAPAIAGKGWEVLTTAGRVTVPPERLVRITPRIEGKVVAAYGTVGDPVRPGQLLAVISSMELAEARAAYRQALAQLVAAERNEDREQRSARLGAASARPVEEARADLLAAEGELAEGRTELAQAQAQLAAAESELTQCKARLTRARELFAERIVSKQEVETAEAEFRRDTAAVDAARAGVARAENRIETARSKVEIAKQYLAREERVLAGRLVDDRALLAARAAVESARLDVQAAAERIRVLGGDLSGKGDTLSIVSPTRGRIVARDANVGEAVTPATALFTVADLSQVWVEAEVYEKDLGRVRLGQPAEIRLDAYPERVLRGKVASIGDLLSSDSRTVKVRCVVPNSGGMLRGGMFASVSLLIGNRGASVLIPHRAILDDAGKKIVFAACMDCAEDKATGRSECGGYDRREVTLGPRQGDMVAVLQGLEPGAIVVTTGAYQLNAAFSSGSLQAGCADGH